ncbi:MAG TPA: glyoxalase superfamily protein [Terriglobia bacterium]|nr:glyoxalase superfamily protein [Terriglobia bacterium]
MAVEFQRVIPILRIFSIEKAREFYVDYLGFKIDWEHRYEEHMPLYMQVSRRGLLLHLSEHHGDGSPGATIRVEMTGVEDLHRELTAKNYRYFRPGIEVTPWKTKEMGLIDPFGNNIRFSEHFD